MHKYVKIIATIGPASEKYSVFKKMVTEGVDIARLNFSHGTYENHTKLIENVRRAEKDFGKFIGIMQDIQGPKIRLGKLPDEGVLVKTGSTVIINTSLKKYDGKNLPLFYPGIEKFVKVGHRLLIDDGHIELKVVKVSKNSLTCLARASHTLHTYKGVNFPDSSLKISILSKKDKEDLKFGVKMGIDIVALSFVDCADDIRKARRLIEKYEKDLKKKTSKSVFLIAKIERHEALKNIDEILEVADGVMVARGDLAIETVLAEMPLAQKLIIDKANKVCKPVIVATQMLDSMQHNHLPTRAEITDVANAVIDHADALMLSNETATGDNPVEVIQTMSEIVAITEKSHYDDVNQLQGDIYTKRTINKAVAGLSGILAVQVGAKAMLVASATGRTARLVSKVRPALPIYAGTESERAARQLTLSWGIISFILPRKRDIEDLVASFLKYVKKERFVKKGDRIVMITGEPVGAPGSTNLLEVKEIE